ncbi:TetR/AcrR family transcriptional regulator [Amycolatopsis sp. QT-25]|uniref:TetR/AcrR family transcriptional regulator n=1 Tax=Amycolatopsis sp. QT-25 TaxID=3034022 RepID=UPI0023EBE683|nr:TetR/AcrR family transcriptional regulator [Amycolatopsis sp. QT-25]WET78982.1 TetR/AcrR family transcriptional regulator [Amycolatopsis sp. QT-25]
MACGEYSVTIVTMYSPEDRTAKAIIRDTAVELFGRHGADAVPLRNVAVQAEVSQALIIKHYGSRDGLITAADEHVLGVTERLLHGVVIESGGDLGLDAIGAPLSRLLGTSSTGPYLAKLLTGEGTRSRHAFERLAEFARGLIEQLAEEGMVASGVDRDDLAVLLLVHDLSVLILRTRITEAFGVDPLDGAGAERLASITKELYSGKALTAR